MTKDQGFTLLEILVALTVFAILATLTSAAMYHAFDTRNRVNEQANRLNQLQLAVSMIENDAKQVIDRPVRGNEMRLFPIFNGNNHYVEFTRDGLNNPLGEDRKSSLKRVALVCEKNKLLRRSWSALDPMDHNRYEDRLLLDELKDCHFAYLSQSLERLSEWRENALNQNQGNEPFPQAIILNLNHQHWGKASFLFIIPEAIYYET